MTPIVGSIFAAGGVAFPFSLLHSKSREHIRSRKFRYAKIAVLCRRSLVEEAEPGCTRCDRGIDTLDHSLAVDVSRDHISDDGACDYVTILTGSAWPLEFRKWRCEVVGGAIGTTHLDI